VWVHCLLNPVFNADHPIISASILIKERMAEEIDKNEFAWIKEVFKKKEVFTGLSYT
jgi:hypothetical protein